MADGADGIKLDVSGAVAIEGALAVVRRTLDRLTERGDDEAAFEVARAQFSASVRASWPANMAKLVGALEEVVDDQERKLEDPERAELRAAIETLRRVEHP